MVTGLRTNPAIFLVKDTPGNTTLQEQQQVLWIYATHAFAVYQGLVKLPMILIPEVFAWGQSPCLF
jgi:hypothetical protein